jgi:hypothetical protein
MSSQISDMEESQESKIKEEDFEELESGESPEITDPAKINETLLTLVNKLCVIRVEHENFAQPGKLLTDGKGFGFNGSVGFLPEFVEKIYPIAVDISKNEVRAVIYLRKP